MVKSVEICSARWFLSCLAQHPHMLQGPCFKKNNYTHEIKTHTINLQMLRLLYFVNLVANLIVEMFTGASLGHCCASAGNSLSLCVARDGPTNELHTSAEPERAHHALVSPPCILGISNSPGSNMCPMIFIRRNPLNGSANFLGPPFPYCVAHTGCVLRGSQQVYAG